MKKIYEEIEEGDPLMIDQVVKDILYARASWISMMQKQMAELLIRIESDDSNISNEAINQARQYLQDEKKHQ